MRVREVVSVEPNTDWAESTRRSVDALGNVRVVNSPVAEAGPRLLADPRFDVVIVDHTHETSMSRPAALKLLSDSVTIAVLDDSDRTDYRFEHMSEWQAERFVSLRPRPFAATETTIFTRNV
jgi:hypothetical protein